MVFKKKSNNYHTSIKIILQVKTRLKLRPGDTQEGKYIDQDIYKKYFIVIK